jgi:hypothetical protein
MPRTRSQAAYKSNFRNKPAFKKRGGDVLFPSVAQIRRIAAEAIQAAMRKKSARSKAEKAYRGNLRLRGYPNRKGGMYHRHK